MAEVESKLDTLTVIKRNGKKVEFDEKKIAFKETFLNSSLYSSNFLLVSSSFEKACTKF